MSTSILETNISNLHHSKGAAYNTSTSFLEPAHLQEWLDSGADLELIYLNVRSLSGDEVYRYLIPDPQAVTRKQHPDAQWRYIRSHYSYLENGGWWCSGVDPTTGEPMLWGCFKPSTPRPNFEKPGRVVKYEHPFKTNMQAIFLNVPHHLWLLVSQRYDVPLSANPKVATLNLGASAADGKYIYTECADDSLGLEHRSNEPPISFWQWVHANNIPITITEGAKKAAALLSIGIAAIAIPGISSGYRSQKDNNERVIERALIPDLQHFAIPSRVVHICFDFETRPRSIRDLTAKISNFSRLFNNCGCIVKICQLPGPDKGVDDFIVGKGKDAYEQVHENALTLDQWQVLGFFALTYVSVRLNQQFIGDLDLPPEAKLVGIKSPKGSGKTEWLIKIVAARISVGLPTLVLTHRVQLGQAICDRIGLPYVTEVGDFEVGKLLGFGLCVDSLHPQSQARFNSEYWSDALVIMDECEQVIWHTLAANTDVKKARSEVISQLAQLLRGALTNPKGGVILLDADLSDISIEFVQGVSGIYIEPWIVLNEWRPKEGRKVYVYGDKTIMFACLEQKIKEGNKVLIITQAQKAKSKFGTRNIESRLRSSFPDLRLLRIDSHSVADPQHPACGCISHLNTVLPNYDVVICSPSLESGVSIDIQGHFSSVWAFMQGVSPVNTACQSVARLRELVELHLWATKRGLSFFGNRSTNHKALIAGQRQVFRSNLALIGIDVDGNCVLNDTAIEIWGKMAARINHGMHSYQASVIAALQTEGHSIMDAEISADVNFRQIDIELKAISKQNDSAHCADVAKEDSTDMSPNEYEILKAKKLKTTQELNLLQNYEISQRYGTDVTPELVKLDEEGLYPQLRLMYFLTVGREYLNERDRNVVETMKGNGGKKLWIPDVNKSLWSVSVNTLELLGFSALIAEVERDFRNSDEDLALFGAKALQYRVEIKEALGITIPKNATPIVAFRLLLKKVGVKLKCCGRDGSGERLRYYCIQKPDDGREEIFANWASQG